MLLFTYCTLTYYPGPVIGTLNVSSHKILDLGNMFFHYLNFTEKKRISEDLTGNLSKRTDRNWWCRYLNTGTLISKAQMLNQ